MDLKILMSIFEYDFVPFNSTNGALVHNKKDKEFLENLCKSYINPENRILFGDGKHWQILTGLYTRDLDKWIIKNEIIAPKASLKEVSGFAVHLGVMCLVMIPHILYSLANREPLIIKYKPTPYFIELTVHSGGSTNSFNSW